MLRKILLFEANKLLSLTFIEILVKKKNFIEIVMKIKSLCKWD